MKRSLNPFSDALANVAQRFRRNAKVEKSTTAKNPIGLLMICDEQDMLEEALRNHSIFCDFIFVLDGTTGEGQKESERICRNCPSVAGYWADAETGYPQPVKDGARKFLHEKARERFGVDNWYVVLHGDEIWGDDPRVIIEKAGQAKEGIAVLLYHFFPHTSQQQSWDYKPGKSSIEECATYYMLPGIREERLFLDTGANHYSENWHSKVIPVGLKREETKYVVKQYNYRTPEQAHRRSVQREESNWQRNHYQHLLENADNFFIDTLASKEHVWAAMVPVGEGEVANTKTRPLPVLR